MFGLIKILPSPSAPKVLLYSLLVLLLFNLTEADILAQDAKSIIAKQDPDKIIDLSGVELFVVVDEMPEFPGGKAAMTEYIDKEKTYPTQALNKGIKGMAIARCVMNTNGYFQDCAILRDPGGGLGNEVIRILYNMPQWEPGKQREQTVNVQYNIPVRFELPKTPPVEPLAAEKSSAKTDVSSPASDSEEDKKNLEIAYDDIFLVVEEMPSYPGGTEAMKKFLYENIEYPKEAENSSGGGFVVIKFIVNSYGYLQNFEVLRDPGYGLGEEALRVAKMMPKWNPGLMRGVPKHVSYNLPVRFSDYLKWKEENK